MATIFDKIIDADKITGATATRFLAEWDIAPSAAKAAFIRKLPTSFARGIPSALQLDVLHAVENPWRVLKDPCVEVQHAATGRRHIAEHGSKLASLLLKATHVDVKAVAALVNGDYPTNVVRFLKTLAKRDDLAQDASFARLCKKHGVEVGAAEKQERAPRRSRRAAPVAQESNDVEQFMADLREADLDDKSVLTNLRKEARSFAIDLPAAVRNALGVTLTQARKLVKALTDAGTVSQVRAAVEALVPEAEAVDYVSNFENASTPTQIRKAAQELLDNAKAADIELTAKARRLLREVVNADSARAVKAAQKAAYAEIVGEPVDPEPTPTRRGRRTAAAPAAEVEAPSRRRGRRTTADADTGATTSRRRRSGAQAKAVDLYEAFQEASAVREMRNTAKALLDNEKLSAAAKRLLNRVIEADGAAAVRKAHAAAVANVCGAAQIEKTPRPRTRVVADPTVELESFAQQIIDLEDAEKADLIAARSTVREILPSMKELLAKLNLSRLAKDFLSAANAVTSAKSVSEMREALATLKEEAAALAGDKEEADDTGANDLDVQDDLDDLDDIEGNEAGETTEVEALLEQILSSEDLKEARNIARDILEDIDLNGELADDVVEALTAMADAKSTSAVRAARDELTSVWSADAADSADNADDLDDEGDETDGVEMEDESDLAVEFASLPLRTADDVEDALAFIDADADAFIASVVSVAGADVAKAKALIVRARKADKVAHAKPYLQDLSELLSHLVNAADDADNIDDDADDLDDEGDEETGDVVLDAVRALVAQGEDTEMSSTEIRTAARELLQRLENVEFGDDADAASVADVRDALSAIAEAAKSSQVREGLELLSIALELMDDEEGNDDLDGLHDEEDEDLDAVTTVAGAKAPVLRKARSLSQVLADDKANSLADAEDDLLDNTDLDDIDDDHLSRVVRRVRGRRV